MLAKKIILLLSLSFFLTTLIAQQKMNAYQRSWKKIDSLVNRKGLAQSALKEVGLVYSAAKKEQNDPQVIKALLYRLNLREQLTENGETSTIADIEKEIATSKEPSKSILQNIAAEAYWNFLQQSRWKLYGRTATISFDKKDIATWGTDDLHRKISSLYLASIANKNILQKTSLELYNPIITQGNTRQLRPTLFDLLGHRALDYFKNDERNISKPAYSFEISDPEAFASAKIFSAHTFNSADSSSLHHKALQLFQELIAFHLADKQPEALIDVDLERIQFVQSNSVLDNKNDLYKNSLESLIEKYPSSPAITQAMYLLAEWHMAKARSFNAAGDTANRYAALAAKTICEKAMLQKQNSEGKDNCANLLKEITGLEIRLQAEKVNIPDQAFRILLNYRNLSTVYFRLIKTDIKGIDQETWQDDYWKKLLQRPAIKTFSQSLPATDDYQLHRTELKIDGLPFGEYALLASTEKNFNLGSSYISMQSFFVSAISYINKNNSYYILHRETGQPLPQARIQVWQQYYDYTKNKNAIRKGAAYNADKNGFFSIPVIGREQNVSANLLEITTANDRLFSGEQIYSYNYMPSPTAEAARIQGFLFADRGIYRPGQTIFFKGILVNTGPEKKQYSVAANRKSTVILNNANGEPIDSLILTTNEFGSYAGKFTLPSGILNGEFSLRDNNAQNILSFSVEEYKRPGFYVELPNPGGTYRVNDSITIKGAAKAYAGNNINNAAVSYRVVRRAMMPLFVYAAYSFKRWPPYGQSQMEIAHGITRTDAEGNFLVNFKAIPDNSIDKKNQPVFYYEVSADITDINGETRSGSVSTAVGYQALKLQLTVPEKWPAPGKVDIKITSANMNDIAEKVTATVSVYRLAMPSRVFRKRYWETPDQFVMSREEFYRNFPYDVYQDENDMSKWARKEKVFDTASVTNQDSGLSVSANWLPGWYIIETSARDKYNEAVTDKRYISVFESAKGPSAIPGYASVASGQLLVNKNTAQPGERLHYSLSTNLDSAFVIYDITGSGRKETISQALIDRGVVEHDLPITESDRGSITLNMAFVKHNRVYSEQADIDIPFTNKQLTIDYLSFRDKTLPGSAEQWKVKIRGYKGDKVAAELLTTMYDASLDQFKPNNWGVPSLWTSEITTGSWTGAQNFMAISSIEKIPEMPSALTINKQYDLLNTGFQLLVSGGFYTRVRGVASMNAPAAMAMAKKSDDREEKSDSVSSNESVENKPAPPANIPGLQVRKNFNETAFFFPQLIADSSGNIEFSFVTPEALTKWKWMLLAHTPNLAFSYGEKTMVTQKQLMVQPNAPRFLREGDKMDFSAKIVNMSSTEITGQVELQLIDPFTNRPVDGSFKNIFPNQYFTVAAGQSVPASFSIDIPFQYNQPVLYRLIASAKITDSAGKPFTVSDGEEALLPVISNRILVTETLPLPVKINTPKKFSFDKLLKSGDSETLQHQSLSVEFTSNPAWYAVQALPYLSENTYDNAEQLFNRFYANALASSIANTSPAILKVFEKWKSTDTAALLSALQKNEELKSVLLRETPWVLEAKTETQQKKNIALLFDMARMSKELPATLARLRELQSPNGGFVWFKGGPDDRYMTQYILSGIGKLKKLNAIPASAGKDIQAIVNAGIPYLDKRLKDDYTLLKKKNKKPTIYQADELQVQYLYMRSFFIDHSVPGDIFEAYHFYRQQAAKGWLKQSKYMQGLIALSLSRTGDGQTAKNILASLKQYAIVQEEKGMYWKEATGYYWYQSPVEMQSLMIEAFTEIIKDIASADNLKTWLLKNKQTNNWKTSRATADACYALLLNGSDWLTNAPEVSIRLGEMKIVSEPGNAEAGTGYFKKTIEGKKINPAMGNITVNVTSGSKPSGNAPAWGAVYWQYFEDLEKISSAATPLKLNKKLFVEKLTDRGAVLEPLNNRNTLAVGDKVKVRIELTVDRPMEYVHMKDMRASCMEPVNTLSSYKWQGGLGYYETTNDASTSFFFNYLPKGTYVFEYALFVTHNGTYSNGITTIQSMYAPEFTSHSEGIKVNVETK
ncbi:MAG: alpha-2-macroglobulin family protein [Flavitalea sp.]